MRNIAILGVVATVWIVGACSKEPTTQPATPDPAQQPYAQQPYPQQQPYAQQPYPQQQPYAQQPAAAPTAAAPAAGAPAAAGGQMATPGPLALPCQNDQACGFARCNVQYGKCAFPCQNTAVDCGTGNTCNTMTGLCLPGGAQ